MDSLSIIKYAQEMNVLGLLKNAVQSGINTLSGRVGTFIARPRKPAFPLADRLLADAFRLGQIPSPTEREAARTSFVAERLDALHLPYTVDEAGNILVELNSQKEDLTDISSEPLLVFTPLVSKRWNSLESLGKLELLYAKGAGLADALGPAALLSLAEAYADGRLCLERDLYLFFSALHFDDPFSDAFRLFTFDPRFRPAAAIGVRGFMLGFLASHTMGSYRVELTVSEEEGQKNPNGLVSALIDKARLFQKAAESFGDDLRLYITRIGAQSSFNRTPQEGALELELESSNGEILEAALERVKAVAETAAHEAVKGSFRVVSSVPPGDPAVSQELTALLLELMKELRIKSGEEAKPDPASFFSARGIASVSVGIALGREGLTRDTVEITSIEKGRQLLERLVMEAGGQHGR
ncbi:hypothetical protein AGMMS50230_06640 [Spirochaetia bacterium]|nr:hypothetical protein AGMMS50230_06640 [Spirochaetia bacterium]